MGIFEESLEETVSGTSRRRSKFAGMDMYSEWIWEMS